MPKYKAGTWDGYISLYQRRGGTFPGGLTARAAAALQEHGVDVDIEDRSAPPLLEPQLAGARLANIDLRPYQVEAAQRAQDAKRGVFDAATGLGKCVAPLTRILTADLRWVYADSLAAGDWVVGFDEKAPRGGPRRLRMSRVEEAGRAVMPCYELVLETGERIVATDDHKWLVRRDSYGNVRWASAAELYEGRSRRRTPIEMPRYFQTWLTDMSHGGGYLRGVYDGEGSVRNRLGSFHGIAFSQRDNTVLADTETELHRRGFSYSRRTASKGVENLDMNIPDGIRFLGEIRPNRLLARWQQMRWPRLSAQEWVKVVSIQPIGDQEVVTLRTSTKTFIAEGFGNHNTEIMAEMIRRLQCRSLIIVPTRDLAWQTIRRFTGTDREPARLDFPNADPEQLYGIVGDDIDSPGLITAALYQTLVRRLTPVCERCGRPGEIEGTICSNRKCLGALDFSEAQETREWLATFDALHLDECHRAVAKTWWPVVNACPAYWRLGYSATPMKSDPITELKLVGATGEVFYSFKAKEAIAGGWLTEPFVVMVDPGFLPLLDEDRYIDVYRDGVVDHVKRNQLIADIAQGTSEHWGVPTLILVQWVEHGRNIRRALRQIGVSAEFISGHDPTEARLGVVDALRDGHLKCAISTTIFDEGVNVPEIGALILAGGGKARHKVIQRIGRGLRVVPGKDYLAVFDFLDTHSGKYLLAHSNQRLRAVQDAGFPQETLTPKILMARIRKGDIRT